MGMEEERDSYMSENVFFVPKEARWNYIKDHAKQKEIWNIIDQAMVLIERENVFPLETYQHDSEDYLVFLELRRKMMAQKLKKFYETI